MASKKNITLKKIKESLVEQLDKKGAKTPVFLALVDDYLKFVELESACREDIKKNCMAYQAVAAQCKNYDKDNTSLNMDLAYSDKKLSILNQLGLTTDNILNEEDNFESELLHSKLYRLNRKRRNTRLPGAAQRNSVN